MFRKTIVLQCLLIHLGSPMNYSSDFLREKRFVKYPKGSAVGYIVALAIPTEDIVNDVFLAFNFEANFILPDFETGTYASKYDLVKRSSESQGNLSSNNVDRDTYSRIKETFTRKNVYAAIESQLFRYGLNGSACILKTICETAEIPLYEYNGIFGSLFHIIFTPSSSENEELPNEIYEAELKGSINQCNVYHTDCPMSILEFVAHTIY